MQSSTHRFFVILFLFPPSSWMQETAAPLRAVKKSFHLSSLTYCTFLNEITSTKKLQFLETVFYLVSSQLCAFDRNIYLCFSLSPSDYWLFERIKHHACKIGEEPGRCLTASEKPLRKYSGGNQTLPHTAVFTMETKPQPSLHIFRAKHFWSTKRKMKPPGSVN